MKLSSLKDAVQALSPSCKIISNSQITREVQIKGVTGKIIAEGVGVVPIHIDQFGDCDSSALTNAINKAESIACDNAFRAFIDQRAKDISDTVEEVLDGV